MAIINQTKPKRKTKTNEQTTLEKTKYWQGSREMETLVYSWSEHKAVQPAWKIIWCFPQKIKNRTTIWSRNCTSGFIPKRSESRVMFSVVVFTAKRWKQPKFPSIDEWINKTWWVHAKSLQSCPTQCNPLDCSPPGSSVHGILQARILEWVAMPSSRGSSRPRDRTRESPVAPTLQADSLLLSHWGRPKMWYRMQWNIIQP